MTLPGVKVGVKYVVNVIYISSPMSYEFTVACKCPDYRIRPSNERYIISHMQSNAMIRSFSFPGSRGKINSQPVSSILFAFTHALFDEMKNSLSTL